MQLQNHFIERKREKKSPTHTNPTETQEECSQAHTDIWLLRSTAMQHVVFGMVIYCTYPFFKYTSFLNTLQSSDDDPCVQLPGTLTQLIRAENNAKMNHVVLGVVSRANADGRGHIKDKELVGALALRGCTGGIKLCLILIHYANLAAVFPQLKPK